MDENQLRIIRIDLCEEDLFFRLSDNRVFTINTLGIIKFCIERERLDVDSVYLRIMQFAFNNMYVNLLLYNLNSSGSNDMTYHIKIPHCVLLDFVLCYGKPFEIERTIEIKTECFSTKINTQKLRDAINQGLISYVPDCEDQSPRDTLIIREASKFLKPLLDEFGFETLQPPPTEKQIRYAAYLADRMCVELPKQYTKSAYSDFISHWKPLVKQEDDAMNEPSSCRSDYWDCD